MGATFAYFTATFTEEGAKENKEVTVKTRALTNVTFNYGDNITVDESVYPGWKGMRALHVTGSGEENAENVTITLSLTPDAMTGIDAKHVKYYVYHATDSEGDPEKSDENFCTASDVKQEADGNNIKFYDAMTCEPQTAQAYQQYTGTAFEASKPVNIDIEVTRTTNEWYYVVIEYVNDEGAQDTEQGKSFSITMDTKLKLENS